MITNATMQKMLRQIDEIIRTGDRLQIESFATGYEVTVFDWFEGHFHVQGATLPEAVNRAHKAAAEKRSADR